MHTKLQGFTLLELMMVVAIVAVLAVIAVPVYQDYIVRARVTEGLSFAAAAKTAISEYYQANSVFPGTNAMAGVPTTVSGSNVSSLVVGTNGVITITYTGGPIAGKTLSLTPTASSGSVTWVCSASASGANAVSVQYVPATCR